MKRLLLIVFTFLSAIAYGQTPYYFYTPEGKKELPVHSQRLLVKFRSGISPQDQQTALSRVEGASTQFEADAGRIIPNGVIASLSGQNGIDGLLEMLIEISQLSDVEWVNPFLTNPDGTIQAITNRALVELRNPGDLSLLIEMVHNLGGSIGQSNLFNPKQYTVFAGQNLQYNGLELARILHESGSFAYAQPDFLRVLYPDNFNDPLLDDQWSINNDGQNTDTWGGTSGADMNVLSAWNKTQGDPNIKIAIIDEGVDLNHPDLRDNLLPGYDATGQGSAGATNGSDPHGTACAGIVAAVADNNIGVAGVAPKCKLIPIRIAYRQNGGSWITSDTWISDAINWAWQVGNADILSNSWGGGSSSFTITQAIQGARNQGRNGLGCPVFFSAGNNNSTADYFPASLSETIAVVAMSMCYQRKSPNSCDGESWGSNYGNRINLSAPGVKIHTTDISGASGYTNTDYTATFNGTSSACPNAAGVMALVLSVNNSLTATQAQTILEGTCRKVGNYSYANSSSHPSGSWTSELGYGLIDADAAVTMAMGNSENDASISGITGFPASSCESTFNPQVQLTNSGSLALTSVNINYQLDNGPVTTQQWTGNLISLNSETINLPSVTTTSGPHSFRVFTSDPNNTEDDNPDNDERTATFQVNNNALTLTLRTDNYPSETSWSIRDDQGATLAAGDSYSNANTTYTENFCLPNGCFTFQIDDSFGDGICCSTGSGNYRLTDADGNILAEGGDFSSSESTEFCVPVSNDPPLEASIASQQNVSCNGGSDGTATANAQGGSGTYAFSWSNGASTNIATGLTAGTYTVTVDDGNTTATASVTISQPPALSLSVTKTDATQGNNNGSATATTSGGTAPYAYAWSTGATTAAISNLAPGTYALTVTDSKSCQANASVTIESILPPLEASITSQQNVSCNGGSDGTATAAAQGGSGTYAFSWSNGATAATATGLAAGTYTVTVDDGNTTATASVTITQPAALSLSVTKTDATQGNNDGSATASTSGGTPPYTYAWSNGATTAAISNLEPGTYSVTATDARGCTQNASVTIGTQNNAVDAAITAVNAPSGDLCTSSATPQIILRNNGPLALTSATISYRIDNAPPQNFNWSGNLDVNTQTTVSLPAVTIPSGQHTFTAAVVDANGQTDSEPANNQASASFDARPNNLTLTLRLDNYPSETSWNIRDAQGTTYASGSGYSTRNGTVTVNVCLPDGCFDFQIQDSYGDGICCTYGQGFYRLTDADGNILAEGGDFASSETTNFCVPVSSDPPLEASIASQQNVSCNGGSDGTATAAAQGGSGTYAFSWSNGATTATATGLAAGTYTVTVNDGNTTATTSLTITQPPALSLSVTKTDATESNNDGSATASASGGTSPYSYAWSNGATTAAISNLEPGTYAVTTTDARGCTQNASITIGIQNNAIDAAITAVNAPSGDLCINSATPQIVLRNNGPEVLTSATINYRIDNAATQTYNWSGNLVANTQTTVSLPAVAIPSGQHTFTATLVLANGQTDSDPANNQANANFNARPNNVTLTLRFDNYPSETSWSIRDAQGTTYASGSGYSARNATLTVDICLPDGCFDFLIQDSYGDGICCTYGQGFYSLADANGNILAEGGDFTSSETTNFCLPAATNAPLVAGEDLVRPPVGTVPVAAGPMLRLFPNPARHRLNVDLNLGADQQGILRIVDLAGRELYRRELTIEDQRLQIDLSQWTTGLYFLQLISNEERITKRFTLQQ